MYISRAGTFARAAAHGRRRVALVRARVTLTTQRRRERAEAGILYRSAGPCDCMMGAGRLPACQTAGRLAGWQAGRLAGCAASMFVFNPTHQRLSRRYGQQWEPVWKFWAMCIDKEDVILITCCCVHWQLAARLAAEPVGRLAMKPAWLKRWPAIPCKEKSLTRGNPS